MKKPYFSLTLLFLLLFSIFSLTHLQIIAQETFTSRPFNNLQNVVGFTMNDDETIMVVEVLQNGRHLLYTSQKENGNWSDFKPIREINQYSDSTANIGGPFLGYQGKKLYFHANFADTKGGMDIYFSEWDGKMWQAPVNLGEPVNSIGNEESPSITVTNDKIFFTRDNLSSKVEREKEQLQCKTLFFSTKNYSGQWESAISLPEPINLDCEASPCIAPDGQTLYFASIRNESESFDVFYTKVVMKNYWVIPLPITCSISENDDFDPEYHNGTIYNINSFIKKRKYNGSVYFNSTPEDMKPLQIFDVTGTLSDPNGKPLEATLQVMNPITSELIGIFSSDKATGMFSLPLLTNYTYLVNIHKQGYSFASFEANLSKSRDYKPQNIILFNTINLTLTVFDSEIFRPLVSAVAATDQEGEQLNIKCTNVGQGRYSVELPIGQQYKIKVNSEGFESGEFDFALTDDIIFSEFERNMLLTPRKKEFEINISDFETQQDVAAEIVIKNLDRDETIVVKAEDFQSGKTTVMLREGDRYEFNIKGPKGYAFYNNTVNLKSDAEVRTLDVELRPLNAKTSITLNNITFELNSADLNEVSFAELNRVVSLIQDNPSIIVEISAHTDDIGSDKYNLKLSERRAESVVNYLVEKGVPIERLVAKGYGESVPVVANSSDENRSFNRRVEFKIIGFTNEKN